MNVAGFVYPHNFCKLLSCATGTKRQSDNKRTQLHLKQTLFKKQVSEDRPVYQVMPGDLVSEKGTMKTNYPYIPQWGATRLK